jgi:branched-chain amino acid aminotransferase
MGLEVEERPVAVEELKTFEEAGACGTAAVISPIGHIFDLDTGEKIIYGDGETVGANCLKLYNALQDIQYGRAEDVFGWAKLVEGL